jgi:hypothetical protein
MHRFKKLDSTERLRDKTFKDTWSTNRGDIPLLFMNHRFACRLAIANRIRIPLNSRAFV